MVPIRGRIQMETIEQQITIARSELRILQRAMNVAKDNLFQAELRLERLIRNSGHQESQYQQSDPRKQING